MLELKKFHRDESYLKFSKEVDGVFIYTGRILPSNQIEVIRKMTEHMKDLSSTTFCVPLLARNSPISYSIVMDFHWNNRNVKHAGIETTHRKILKYVHILGARDLIKFIQNSCERCKYNLKKTIDVSMGPVFKSCLTIAPAFYTTLVVLAQPFKSYSFINKRGATLEI